MSKTSATRLWMRAHNYIATFFLPAALLCAVTGGLYILGVHGKAHEQVLQVVTEDVIPEDIGTLQALAESQLRDHQRPIPQGRAQLVHGRFFWG